MTELSKKIMTHIILAGVENADTIADLAVKTFYETYGVYNTIENMELYTRQHYSNSKIAQELKHPEIQYFLASHQDKPAGFAKMGITEQPEFLVNTRNIEIQKIYVLKKFQNIRIGKSLVEECIQAAKNLGYEVVWLGVWQQNLEAVEFYEKNGFEKFGTHSFLLGGDLQTDWLMKRKL